MPIQDDISFLKRLNFEQFKQIEKYKFNFRCPICDDSKKSIYKSRGYAISHKKKDSLFVYCHNCGYQNGFFYFLKDLKDKGLIDNFSFDSYVFNNKTYEDETIIIDEKESEFVIKENRYLINVNRLKKNNIIHEYLKYRRIDERFFDDIYFSINFKKLINEKYITDKYKTDIDIPRIVFPIVDDKLIGFQGRCLSNESKYRYLNVKLNENSNFIYRQKNIDENKIVFVTEGIFDCLVLDNSISMLGSNLSNNVLREFKNVIFIYDNEKGNEILRKYEKIIEMENVGLFIWPKRIKYKDVNEWAIREGKENIENTIIKNSYFDVLRKKINFLEWR